MSKLQNIPSQKNVPSPKNMFFILINLLIPRSQGVPYLLIKHTICSTFGWDVLRLGTFYSWDVVELGVLGLGRSGAWDVLRLWTSWSWDVLGLG
jgi:hypothetical protein